MSQKTKHVWPTLLEAGLAEDAEPKTDKLESPWYVKVLLAFSGWLAALPLQKVVVLHANHANEFDASVDAACARLREAGATLLNQSVLLNIPVGAPRTIVSVHKDAVIRRQGGTIVFTVIDGKAALKMFRAEIDNYGS